MTTTRDPDNIYIGVRPGKKGKLVPFGHRRDRNEPSPALRESQQRFREAMAAAGRLGLTGEAKTQFLREFMNGFRASQPAMPGRFRTPRVWEGDLKKAGFEEGLKVEVEPQSDGTALVTVVPEEDATVEVVIEEEPEQWVEVVIEDPEEEKRRRRELEGG